MPSSSELLPSKPQGRLQLWFLTRADSSLTFVQQLVDKDDMFFWILKNISIRVSWTRSFAFSDRMQISFLALNRHVSVCFFLCFLTSLVVKKCNVLLVYWPSTLYTVFSAQGEKCSLAKLELDFTLLGEITHTSIYS